MISKSINTQRTLEKDFGIPLRPKPETENAESDQGLFTENTRKMGMILLMIGYHKEPIATGSAIKRCNS